MDFIQNIAQEMQLDPVGFSKLPETYQKRFPKMQSVITLVVPLSTAVVDEIDTIPTATYYQHYRTVNAYIDHVETMMGLALIRRGIRYIAVPASQSVREGRAYAGIFPHKTGAVNAGLGFIGRSALFVSYRYGPRVRLGSILTDAPIETLEEPMVTGACGSCRKCVEACPAHAITGVLWQKGMPREELMNAEACSQYMKTHFQNIGRGSVCGLCMRACPYGSDLGFTFQGK